MSRVLHRLSWHPLSYRSASSSIQTRVSETNQRRRRTAMMMVHPQRQQNRKQSSKNQGVVFRRPRMRCNYPSKSFGERWREENDVLQLRDWKSRRSSSRRVRDEQVIFHKILHRHLTSSDVFLWMQRVLDYSTVSTLGSEKPSYLPFANLRR